MLKTIYIHIGLGKTGTSAIQRFFFDNCKKLAEEGVCYPSIGLYGVAHHSLAVLAKPELSSNVRNLYSEIVELVHNSDFDIMFISSEYFSYLRPTYIQELAQYFENLNTKIIFYIRPQDSLIESAFLQRQKIGNDYSETIDVFFKKHMVAYDFMKRIKPWVDGFGSGNIIARVFNKAIIGEDVCLDVLNLIKKPNILTRESSELVNISLLPEFSGLVTLFDHAQPNPEEVSPIRQEFISELLKLSKCYKSDSRLITNDLKIIIQETYLKSNQEFADMFLDDKQSNVLLTTNK